MAIITVSRELGSHGSEVAKLLAERTNSLFLDKKTVEEALEHYGIGKDLFDRYDERKPVLWGRVSFDSERYLHFLTTALAKYAQTGNCVMLGRGGYCVLRGVPAALHIKVIAPESRRVQRVRRRFKCDERSAERIIAQSDRDRAGFHKFFYHSGWDNDDSYDMILNTGKLSVPSAVDIVLHALERVNTPEANHESARILRNLCLEQDVRTALLFVERIPVGDLQVTADEDVVVLRGYTSSKDVAARSQKVAESVGGVSEVINEINYIPHLPGNL